MPFLRPEAVSWLRRHGETLGALAVFGLGLAMFARGAIGGLPFYIGVGGCLILVSFLFIRGAVERLRLSRGQVAPGVVLLDERRLGYFGPDTGGFLETDSLCRVELDIRRGEALWHLTGEQGESLTVPYGAEGAAQLYDLFARLPGLRLSPALDLIENETLGRHLIWTATPATPDRMIPRPGLH
ncbi:hypothetical protein FHS89_000617 [Rubricella aquisinus]|uniref:Uncharacterized protein n=1 Tax=Rubricella aquisinus TaxID=2028108 RepID=A0A840WHM3_9RHOB|nr:hypothetical protein [Rubricella aquisinus]MBB5514619.1 hypothetical protein [Rubricella aquisinus]